MLTPRMKWSDTRFWIICFAAMGYWVGDVRRVQVREARARARRREREREERRAEEEPVMAQMEMPMQEAGVGGRGQGQAPGEEGGQGPAAVDGAALPAHPATFNNPTQTQDQNQNPTQTTTTNPLEALAHLHLTTDARYLQLPLGPSGEAQLTTTRPRARPAQIITQALLPIYLFFITLVPVLENMRAGAIRRRERAMRVIVGELNPPVHVDGTADAVAGSATVTGAGSITGEVAGAEQGAESVRTADGTDPGEAGHQQEQERPAEPITVLPQGLDEKGIKYYHRVLLKGEGIDWEDEREAQRIAEAEFGGGGGGGWD